MWERAAFCSEKVGLWSYARVERPMLWLDPMPVLHWCDNHDNGLFLKV
jgi:hypothetical protein